MNLHREVLQEMTGPIPHELILGEIIRDGDVSNHYQTYVLALLSEFFKSGYTNVNSQLDGLATFSVNATSVSVIETIKSLSPSEKVKLAQHLLGLVTGGIKTVHSTQLSSSDWVRSVLKRQY